eukprot:357859-Chlamydomonas_euryale.AAC.9
MAVRRPQQTLAGHSPAYAMCAMSWQSRSYRERTRKGNACVKRVQTGETKGGKQHPNEIQGPPPHETTT